MSKKVRGKLHTEYVFPPIPIRTCDWIAFYGDYDLGTTVAYGATEAEAIENLKDTYDDED